MKKRETCKVLKEEPKIMTNDRRQRKMIWGASNGGPSEEVLYNDQNVRVREEDELVTKKKKAQNMRLIYIPM